MQRRRLGRGRPGSVGDRPRGDVVRRDLRRGDRGRGARGARRRARPRHRPHRHRQRLRRGPVGAHHRQLPRRQGKAKARPLPHRHQGRHRPRPGDAARAASTTRPRISRRSSTRAWRGSASRRSTSSTCTGAIRRSRSRRWPSALAGLVRAGKARAIGFSEIAPSSLRRAAAVHPVAAVQSEYSLVDPGAGARPGAGLRRARGGARRLLARSAAGCLTDAPPAAETIAASEFLRTNPRFQPPNLAANLRLAAGLPSARRRDGDARGVARRRLAARPRRRASSRSPAPARSRTCASSPPGRSSSSSAADLARIEERLPVGWAHGDRYSYGQWLGPERYC